MNEGNRIIARDRWVTGLMNFKSTKEVIEMNMPGFTAEASLYNVNEHYQATAQATAYGGLNRSPFNGRHEARRALSTAGRFGRLRRMALGQPPRNRPAVGNAAPHHSDVAFIA